jgi:DNA-binding MarR family transcriptional regulator
VPTKRDLPAETQSAADETTFPFSRKPRQSFGYLLRETARRLDRAISKALSRYDLTVSQYHLLRELWNEDGLSVRELATRVSIAEPSTLLTIAKMQRDGLVKIDVDANDRRKRCVTLDARGRKLRSAVLNAVERVGNLSYSKVDPGDMQAAVRVFRAIEKGLE